jgi:cyclase
MSRSPHRRAVLGGVLAFPAALQLNAYATAQAAAGDGFAREIADGVFLLAGPGANVVVARAGGGAVLVDSGAAQSAQIVMAEALRATGAGQISSLINTCWRPAQTGGNDQIGASNVPIVAHENTRLWMGTDIWARWEDKTYPRRAPQARPTETFYSGEIAPLEDVTVGYLEPAHTDGDVYVHFRNANVLAIGAVAAADRWPVADWSTGGWIGGLADACASLVDICDDETVVVPSFGPLMTRADLAARAELYQAISGKLRQMLNQGLGLSEVVAADPTAEFGADLGDPDSFVRVSFQSLWPRSTPDA